MTIGHVLDKSRLKHELESRGVTSSEYKNKEKILKDFIGKISQKKNYDHQFRQFSLIKFRESSFANFPKLLREIPNLSPQEMAKAGFYYTNFSDHVCCFHCGKVLKDFLANDIPLEKHKKENPDCQYAKHFKFDRRLNCYTLNHQKCAVNERTLKVLSPSSSMKLFNYGDSHSPYQTIKNTGGGKFECTICYKNKVDTVFLPCLHESCYDCYHSSFACNPNNKSCFFCRQPIEKWTSIDELSDGIVREYKAEVTTHFSQADATF